MFCLYVKWNRFSCDSPGDGSTIRALCVSRATPEAEACEAGGGASRPQRREWPAPEF